MENEHEQHRDHAQPCKSGLSPSLIIATNPGGTPLFILLRPITVSVQPTERPAFLRGNGFI